MSHYRLKRLKQMTRNGLLRVSVIACGIMANAEETVDYQAEAIFTAGSGDFAPYYIASNRQGVLTQSDNALLRLEATRSMDLSKRFSYGYGAELLSGYSDKVAYQQYNSSTATFNADEEGPAAVGLRQLYGEVKYRGVFLTVGMKNHQSALLNYSLSSGDIVESGNARPIPEVRIGFVDFQDIPFTQGWVQIQGEVAYGKFADNDWLKDHYNYYDWHINLGALYHYKRCYFRTNPRQPFSVTVGMQTAGQFGGTTYVYANGVETKRYEGRAGIKDFFNMFLPRQQSGSSFYEGNSLGSWDFVARYRFNDGSLLKAYVQKPWEDGSGIGWMNGFDGVWGIEYASPTSDAIVSGAVVEYIDFTNQSGPIHWSPGDSPGTSITHNATGADAYYNNFQYNSYMYYGMSIGTPFLPSPIYNTDGYLAFIDSRVRGFHVGVAGRIGNVGYRLLGGYRKGWGDGKAPTATTRHDSSLMAEATYAMPSTPALELKAQLGLDRGNMFGDNFGACVTVAYRGALSFGKNEHK